MYQIIDLSGQWNYEINDLQSTGTIMLPGTSSEAQITPKTNERAWDHLTDPYAFTGTIRYSRTVDLPVADHYELKLERTRISRVCLSGKYIGTKDSLIAPHIYDLSEAAREGSNLLEIEISNTGYKVPGGHMTSPDTQTNWNGIVGEISITCRDTILLEDVRTDCAFKSTAALFTLSLRNLTAKNLDCRIEITTQFLTSDHTEDTAIKPLIQEVSLGSGASDILLNYDLSSDIHYWSEFTPEVYKFTVLVYAGNASAPADCRTVYFGLKEFSHDGEHFLINGHPTFLRGKHDGMSFPLTGYAPMQLSEWMHIFSIAKEYGINHYRYHTCCPPEAAFLAADLAGIYLQPELSFWGTYYAEDEEGYPANAQSFLRKEGHRILGTYGNHPSFCMMSMGNELWGNDGALDALVAEYKAARPSILFTQGSNNFFWCPKIGEHDDFFSGVRFAIDRQIRGSFAACDVPYGHVQTAVPGTVYSYDESIHPSSITDNTAEASTATIQYGTGTKEVAVDAADVLIPQIPVISHEVGQYQFFPDFKEIASYTGVLKPENLKIFRERLSQAGLSHMAESFFRASGNLTVACYKDELETLLRSRHMAGFQLLDLTDFQGQGTALVGILNSLYENKGIISAGNWRNFCSDAVIQAEFPSYIITNGDVFHFEVSATLYRGKLPEHAMLTMTLTQSQGSCGTGATSCADCASNQGDGTGCGSVSSLSRAKRITITEYGYQKLTKSYFTIPEKDEPGSYTLTVSLDDEDTDLHIRNSYTLWSYPERATLPDLPIAETWEEAEELAATRKKTLLLLSESENENSVPGFYTTDFWNYTMFRNISESAGKEVAPGTLGLYIRQDHPALAGFPTRSYTTPQWYHIVSESRAAILDDTEIEPIVWVIDNVERNHKLGLLYEVASSKTPDSSILVCTSNLGKLLQGNHPEVWQFLSSLLNYIEGR